MSRTKLGWIILAVISVFSINSSRSLAVDILYRSDHAVATDRMAQALAALPGGYTVTTATSELDFATQIATNNYDLGILFQQGNSGPNYDAAFAALGTFINSGGRAIAADWSGNNTHALPFGAIFDGSVNNTSFTVTNPALAAGLGNPINLMNPGWGIFSTDLDPSLGSSAATFNFSGDSAIVIGNGGRTIFNGFLNDTFADGAEGVRLFTNEIYAVFAVPEPMSSSLLILGVGGILSAYRRART